MPTALRILLVAAFTGCGHMTPYSEASLEFVELYAGLAHQFQLRIPRKVTVYEPFPTRTYISYDWIAFNGSETALSSDRTEAASCPEGTQSYSSRYPVRGSVALTSSTALVQLEMQIGKGGWQPYTFNGEYRLVRIRSSAIEAGLSQGSGCRLPV